MIEQAERGLKFKDLEEKIQSWWEENHIYEKCKNHRRKGQKYYFLDGPPYASGAIHLGTAWNKILKDAVIRYQSMKGLNVRRQPGWDCHGLPIELKVEEKLGIKNKHEIEALGERKFIEECEKWAYEHVDIMTKQFARLGVWMDWDNPYMTLKNEYIEAAWWTIKKANEKGLLTNDLGIVTWCPRCETALANVEIEFQERVDPSIYVKFPIMGKENEYLLIWTTTPWTLISNLAIMVHPNFEYAKVRTKEGDLILANARVDVLENELNLNYEILDMMTGKDLEGIRYQNPLDDVIDISPSENAYTVILADFVSLEDGTGCVHSAPGHGPEDFEACKPYGIKPISPVDERGVFTEEAGKFAGLTVKKDDNSILETLEEKGALLLSTKISHRYGHCWRCKSPIIYRGTKQWFIKVTNLKEQMLEEADKVEWVPDWAGSSRFKEWIENIKDWTISRQRYWGIPLPLWICKECGNLEAIGSRKELEEKGFKIDDMHKPFVDDIVLKCGCGGEAHRVPDVLDVWFDSGVAAWASLGYPKEDESFKKWYPVDFITEGHDQTRGWFYSQLGCGLIAFDKIPYRRVLQHGFTLDEKGNKMSKSIGNIVQPEEVIEKFGVDVLRFYVLWASKPWDDLRFNWTEIEVINRMFNIFWNSYVFATTYMALDKFDPTSLRLDATKHYSLEDKWIISRLNTVVKEVTDAFESLQIYTATRAIHDFILEDLSRWYIPLIRSRTWMEDKDPKKLAAYHVLYKIFTTLDTILAPISPHVSEEIHKNLTVKFGGQESVHMQDWITSDETMINKQLEKDMQIVRKDIEAITSAREKGSLKRRWPVSRIIVHPTDEDSKSALENLKELVEIQANTHNLDIRKIKEPFREVKLIVEPDMGTIGPDFKGDAISTVNAINSADPIELKKQVKEGYTFNVDEKTLTLYSKHVKFSEKVSDRYVDSVSESGTTVYVDKETTDDIWAERYAREIVRRIQEMRKEMNLDIEAFIDVTVVIKEKNVMSLLNLQSDYVAHETRAKSLKISGDTGLKGFKKEWKINGKKFTISIS